MQNIDLELITLIKGKDNKTEEFFKINPLGKVPVLITDDGVIFESNAICRYLCRLNPKTKLYGKNFLSAVYYLYLLIG